MTSGSIEGTKQRWNDLCVNVTQHMQIMATQQCPSALKDSA